jgi:uncharacterized BrkB/YihY/UPF0761 family membrane protein
MLGAASIFGLLVSLWTANAGMKAIFDALNVVYQEREKRGFVKLNAVSLAFTLAGMTLTALALGAAVGFMLWMWFSSIVLLIGAELNAEMEHQTATDTTEGPPRPLGERGARMADTIGRSKS